MASLSPPSGGKVRGAGAVEGDDRSEAEMRRLWRAYLLLAALRVVASAAFLGMIHPDEFFQSQEVMARHALGGQPRVRRELFLPWEYQLPMPNRSVLFPALVAGGPYKLMEWLGLPLTGLSMLLAPRLLLCALSFAIDATLYASAAKLLRLRQLKTHDVTTRQLRVLVAFASAWPTVAFLTRPFSNTFETLVLALCLAVLLVANPHRRFAGFHVQTLALGELLAVGFFTRFTFAFFFLPVGIQLVLDQDALLLQRVAKKQIDNTSRHLGRRLVNAVSIAAQGLMAFLTVSVALMVLDTLYFRPEMLLSSQPERLEDVARQLVVAPVNNLLYNLQYDNLEIHGVHSRLTHAAVNMPMLFGPLFLLFLVNLARGRFRGPYAFLGASSVLFPLLMLSLAPHQEPRFLLPALVPLHLFAPSDVLVSRRGLFSLWITFNALLGVFFGVLHQGGVVPMMLALSGDPANSRSLLSSCDFTLKATLSSASVAPLPVVFSKVYMPPRFLLAAESPNVDVDLFVTDLGGKSIDELPAFVAQDEEQREKWSRATAGGSALLVVPASVGVSEDVKRRAGDFVTSWTRVGSCGPHVSTEDLGAPFALELYHLTVSPLPHHDSQ